MNKISLQDCLSCVIDNRGVTPHKRSIEWATKGVPVLSANNVKTSGLCDLNSIRFIPSDAYSSWMKIPLEQGDLILTSEAPAGEVLYWDSDEKVVLGQRLFGLKVREGVDAKYLKYYLQSPLGQKAIRNQQSGSTVFGIAASTFSQIAVFLPSDQRQKTSSNLLYAIDKAIENNSSICSDLEATAKLLYDYWFVQFDFPDENRKPYKSSGGKMVWNDELKREIPAGWSCVQLDEIASLINNTVNPSSSTDYLHFSIPAFDEGRTPSLENGGDIESNKFSLPDKCILVSKLNPQFQRVWLVFDERANKISSTEFLPFVPKKACSYELLYEILRSDAFYAYMCNCSSSSTGSRKRMPPELCLEYKIAFPKEDSDLSERFRAATVSILNYLAKIPGESKRLTELRDFLLPLLMNAQVTIGDDGE